MSRAPIADDRYAINLAKTEIREGYNGGDVERVLAQMATRYTDLSHGFPSCAREEARAVLRVRLTVLFERYRVEFAPVSSDILCLGAAAVVTGWHSFTLTPKAGGASRQVRTRFAEVWQREDAGWRLALFIDNADPVPALASDTVAALLAGRLDALTGAF